MHLSFAFLSLHSLTITEILPLLLSLMTTSGHDENEAVEVVSSCLLFSSLRSILHFFQGCLLYPWCCLPIHLQWLPAVHNVKSSVLLSRSHLPVGPHFPLTAPELHVFSAPTLLQTCSALQGHPYFAATAPKVSLCLAHGAAQWTKRLGLTQVQGESQVCFLKLM